MYAKFEEHPSIKYPSYFAETKSLQTIRQTDGHTDDHREIMTSYTKVWPGIKGWSRSVPQNKFTGVISILRNGTEQNKKKKKRFLEKSEEMLIIYDYSPLNIVYVCVHPVCIQARHPDSNAHVCQI